MKIAVVTVDFNRHGDSDEWLASAKILDTKDLEMLWLVVDNGSDVSVKETVAKYPGTVWMQTGKNLGFTGGFNRGMRYAKEWGAEYVLIINNDTVFPEKGLIKKMLKVLEDHPQAGLVSPKIYFAPEFEYYKDRYTKKDEGKVIWYAGGSFDWNNIKSQHRGIDEVDKGKYDKTEKTEFTSGCCVLIKREVLEKVGYFEEKLFAYFEDADWIERVKKAGYEQWYTGSTYIYHKISRTAGVGSAWSDYLITRNRMWFGMKYASNRTKLALWREALRLLLTGRPAQKEGILDFINGVWGWKNAKQPKHLEYPLKLSIIITNYKTTKLILQLLNSIFKEDFKAMEVIVLDNSPDEPCKNKVLTKYPNIKFITNQENKGFSKGNNQMINYSLGENILLLNSDIEVKPGAINILLDSLNIYGHRAIYSGKLYFPNGDEQDSCFSLPTAWGAFKEYFLQIKGSYFMYRPSDLSISKVEGTVMACYLIPHQVIDELGMLQEKTFMYFEDIEYCRRAKTFGIPIYFVPPAHFIHHHGQASMKAGNEISHQRSVEASKWYHGKLNYMLVTTMLWAGQKWGKVTTPVARWKKEKN